MVLLWSNDSHWKAKNNNTAADGKQKWSNGTGTCEKQKTIIAKLGNVSDGDRQPKKSNWKTETHWENIDDEQ